MRKNYSTLVHTLHSRLQLIRNKLDFKFGMEASQMVIRNLKYFEKASESVERFHNFRSDRSDFIDAAELFMSTVEPDGADGQAGRYVVEAYHTVDDVWYPISEETLSNSLSGKIKPMTLAAAQKLHAWVCKNSNPSYVRINNYKQP